jgi:serine protease Do
VSLPEAIEAIAPAIVPLGTGSAARGTGVLVTRAGHVMTCAHVLGDAATVGDTPVSIVARDGTWLDLRVIDFDSEQDLALLEPTRAHGGLTPVRLGVDVPREGEAVAVSGFPGDMSFLVTSQGVVAAGLQEAPPPSAPLPTFFLADLTVDLGDSGAPLYRVSDAVVLGLCKGYVSVYSWNRNVPGRPPNSGLAWITPASAMTRLLDRHGL